MKQVLVVSVLVVVLLVIWGGTPTPEASLAGQAAQAASTATPEAARPGYTNYSGYYRMRCWPACHTKDIPESISPRGYTNYSGYYRMRCWPACHTKDIPESIGKSY